MTQVNEMNEYAVLALDVIHELQRMIDRQIEEIATLRERERNMLQEIKDLRPLVDKAVEKINLLKSQRDQQAEQIEELSRELADAKVALERKHD